MNSKRALLICFTILLVIVVGYFNPSSGIRERPTQKPGTNTTNNFLSISDIHFNPFFDRALINQLKVAPIAKWDSLFATSTISSYGYYGWSHPDMIDTNWKLFKSALKEMKAANATPDFITINGDFLCHEFEGLYVGNPGAVMADIDAVTMSEIKDFILKTVSYLFAAIEKEFPNTPIYPTLGNNDAFCGDYEVRTSGSFLTKTTALMSKSLNGLIVQDSFNTTYGDGGYYIASTPANPNHKIISMNTIILSTKYLNDSDNFCSPLPDSTSYQKSVNKQFAWLERQLKNAQANNQKVWLMYHIPPGYNAFESAQNAPGTCNFTAAPYYFPAYNDRYLSIVMKYKQVITAQLAGHTHMDNFIVIDGDTRPTSFVHISPAISPIYYNNPGFLAYTYRPSKARLKDYTVYGFEDVETASTPNWSKEYTFSSTYGQKSLSPKSLKTIYTNFKADNTTKQHYIDYYVVEDVPSGMDNVNWPWYYCAFGNQTRQSYEDCVCQYTN